MPGFIKASGGVMLIDNLNDNHYGNALADGSYGEIVRTDLSRRTGCSSRDDRRRYREGPPLTTSSGEFQGGVIPFGQRGSDLAERSQREEGERK